ncbi:MAG: hypothetical protein ACRESS_12830 [Stenotrophobium sp.]
MTFSTFSTAAAGETHIDVSGKYTRVHESKNEEADLQVKNIPGGRVHVTGTALWGTDNKYGPNIGQLDFVASVHNGRVHYSDRHGSGKGYNLEIQFNKHGLTATEKGPNGDFGLNVTFEGEYRKQ